MISTLIVNGLSFELPNGRTLFHDLHFSLNTQLTALVGPNGVGKTSLAKLLAGQLEPSKGSIRKNSPIEFLAQREAPLPIPVAEYLAESYTWSVLGDRLLMGIDQETLCSQLSGGQWMRVRLARVAKDRFLILDEPTNDLDREGRDALFEFLRLFESGVLIISHDRECLQLCQEFLELSNQGLTKFVGSWNQYEISLNHKRNNLAHLLEVAKKDRERVKAERFEQMSKQEKRNREGAKAAARGGMPKILLGARKRQSQTTTGKIDSATLQKTENAISEAFEKFNALIIDPLMYADLSGSPIPAQKLIAQAKDFNVKFQSWVFEKDLNFSWRGNLRLALKGKNGSGKSTLVNAILGNQLLSRGQFRVGKLKTLYVDQKCESLDESKNILENVRDVADLDESETRNGLAKFLFAKETVFQNIKSLSGGERLRAALAKGLLATDKPELLILDEPTNNLDLANIKFLENLVSQFQGAVIIISHDETFLDRCRIDEIFNVREGI